MQKLRKSKALIVYRPDYLADEGYASHLAIMV